VGFNLVGQGGLHPQDEYVPQCVDSLVWVGFMRVCCFGARDDKSGDSGYEYGHFRPVGVSERQLRGHAGTKQQQQDLADLGFRLRPPRHNRNLLRR